MLFTLPQLMYRLGVSRWQWTEEYGSMPKYPYSSSNNRLIVITVTYPGYGLLSCDMIWHVTMTWYDMSLWQPKLELLSWFPILKISHCNSFEDWAPVRVPNLQMSYSSDLTTWQGTRIIVPAMATRWHDPLHRWPPPVQLHLFTYSPIYEALHVKNWDSGWIPQIMLQKTWSAPT